MMLRTSQEYIRSAFSPEVFAGLGYLGYLGDAWVDPKTGIVYSGEGADSTAHRGGQDPGSEMPAPKLYATEECGPTDGACIGRNQQRQVANMALLENARRDWNLLVCQNNAALNPGTANDRPCGQFESKVQVPPAPGVLTTAVCSGGQCYAPIASSPGGGGGGSGYQEPGGARPGTGGGASGGGTTGGSPTGVPNQTTPPKPQAGEVPTSGTTGGGGQQQTQAPAGGSFLDGIDSKTLIMIAAGVVVVMFAMKGK
jgi:hypothetical protein